MESPLLPVLCQWHDDLSLGGEDYKRHPQHGAANTSFVSHEHRHEQNINTADDLPVPDELFCQLLHKQVNLLPVIFHTSRSEKRKKMFHFEIILQT